VFSKDAQLATHFRNSPIASVDKEQKWHCYKNFSFPNRYDRGRSWDDTYEPYKVSKITGEMENNSSQNKHRYALKYFLITHVLKTKDLTTLE